MVGGEMTKDTLKKAGIIFKQYSKNAYSLSDDELDEQRLVLEGIIQYLQERGDCEIVWKMFQRDMNGLEIIKKARQLQSVPFDKSG